jgi:hypothetical protein
MDSATSCSSVPLVHSTKFDVVVTVPPFCNRGTGCAAFGARVHVGVPSVVSETAHAIPCGAKQF